MKRFLFLALATAALATTSTAHAAPVATSAPAAEKHPAAEVAPVASHSTNFTVAYTIEERANKTTMNERDFILSRRTALTAAVVSLDFAQVAQATPRPATLKPLSGPPALLRPQAQQRQRQGMQVDSYGTARPVTRIRITPATTKSRKGSRDAETLPSLPLEDRD